ncbi:hypothetical protein JHW43_002074 [Diplocarpon mali]|nr:hypothetical protein JHW43_002074 [Diplocarpon mali]
MRLITIFSSFLALSSGAVAIWCNNYNDPGVNECASGYTSFCCSDASAQDKPNWKDDCQGGPVCANGIGKQMCCK